MKRLTALLLLATFLTGCAVEKHTNGSKYACGSKQQKKAKYNSMKQGRAPGGGMLN